ncbi:amidase [Falsiroseomonas selenitidurans]|uniref:Amidase n=1 Tax=Falsiroseomonas selenitidurans TaxID=2716335 RepID=A0ABX1E273_9PROT|nr:amidase family protein [Falsiroseomonas selenitidurans]NKC31259.1 amidase [Falsiroseomonas selenitidurans]OYW10224.1 MAG: amidase [Rhodospirillales bacterium 12-71-4]
MTDPCDLPAVELRRLIGNRRLSPVELLQSCLRRIETVNPAVNAVVALDAEGGMAAARAAEEAVMRGDRLGALHGLPVGVKDLNDTAGLRTTYGSPMFRDHVPERDERMVAALRQAGAIILAKTNTPEFGTGGNTINDVYGATGNAFDPALSCAGSSGGSGVALATGMLPLCTGSDTGGSLRKPAAWSGVVGFRPTPGLVASEKRRIGWSTLSVQGPMGRDVADTALLLSAMASPDTRDPMAATVEAEALALRRPVDLASLRVAFSVDLGFAPIAPSIRRVFAARMAALGGSFARCVDEAPDMAGIDRAYRVIRCVNFLAGFKRHYERDPMLLGANTRGNYEEGLRYSLADLAAAQAEQTRIYRAFQEFFTRHDLLLSPTQALTPFPKQLPYPTEMEGMPLSGYFATSGITYGISMTGHPALCIPCGVDENGMPFGLQVVGPRGADGFTLDAALALERHFAAMPAFRRPLPDLARLATSA